MTFTEFAEMIRDGKAEIKFGFTGQVESAVRDEGELYAWQEERGFFYSPATEKGLLAAISFAATFPKE